MIETDKYRQIVDENDSLLGHKWEAEFNPDADIYRVASLWLRNGKGDVLIAQRSPKKKNAGGLWGPAVSGTLEYDETYEDNIEKEIREEIGLTGLVLQRGKKRFIDGDNRKFYCVYFYGVSDKPAEDFVLEDAVHAVKWVQESWLREHTQLYPELYVNTMAAILDDVMEDCR